MGTKYICRDYILEEIDEIIGNINFSSPYQNDNDLIVSGLERARDIVYNADIKDVVEVVRCKDCIYRDGKVLGQPNIICCNMKDDDFCSYGERKLTT